MTLYISSWEKNNGPFINYVKSEQIQCSIVKDLTASSSKDNKEKLTTKKKNARTSVARFFLKSSIILMLRWSQCP